jgi:O-antigen/teichoic acid export membrane protein
MTVAARRTSLRRFVGPGTTETAIFGLSVLTGPLVSRALGESGRGSFAAVVVPVQLLAWVSWLGVPYASAMLVRDEPRRTLVDSAWRLAFVVNLPLAVIGWIAAPHLLDHHPTDTVTWFRIGMVCVLLGMPAAAAIHLRMIDTGGTWRTSLALNLHLVVYTPAVVALALAGRLTLATSLAAWIGALMAAAVLVLVTYDGWPHGSGTGGVARQQLRRGRPQAVTTIASVSLGRLDQVFLAAMGASAALGHYAVAVTAAQVSLPVANGIATVVMPATFADADDAAERLGSRVTFVVSAGVAAVTAAAAPWVLPAVFGHDFTRSVHLLWLLLPGQVIFNTAWVRSAGQLGRGEAGGPARALGTAALVSTALLAPAIHLFGAAGAAGLTSSCQALFAADVWRRRTTRRRRARVGTHR